MNSKLQKFKIPFKNSNFRNIELNLLFENNLNDLNILYLEKKFYEFTINIFPNNINISSFGVFELDFVIKLKKLKRREFENIGNSVRKVLIGQIKNSKIFYSFFLEIKFKIN